MQFCPSASFVPQIQLSFPICLFLLSPSFHLILISCFELHPAFNPFPSFPISIRAYLLFTAPRGYLSFSPLHCECQGDARIPQSGGPDPHLHHDKALTPHLHTWRCRLQKLVVLIGEYRGVVAGATYGFMAHV